MSTLAEIEEALDKLPVPQQKKLFALLAEKLGGEKKQLVKRKRKLDSALYPPLEGLPSDLSIETGAKVRTLLKERHAADR